MPIATRPATRPPARKRLAQHFLETAWVSKLVACIRPGPGELFLEIGAGAGQLTLPLAAAGAEIVAIEKDRALAARLREIAPASVRVVAGDVLDEDLARLVLESRPARSKGPARVAGNLPYNISTPILRRLMDAQHRHGCFADATLMLQREVADRVVGRPGSRDYGPLAILTGTAARAERVLTLPPGAFRPPPRVRSAVVALRFRPSPAPVADRGLFERLVRTLFSQRRKTVLNALDPLARDVSPLPARELLERAGVAPERRPATLDPAELARLADILAAAPR
jgi:16S rRNA (adenine1518-N6/adenine1519-N6)-dimethyltransferase